MAEPGAARREPAPGEQVAGEQVAGQQVAVISGLSGAGKTATAKLFEDLGFAVVDNLPTELVPELAELVASEPERFQRVALVLDARAGEVAVALGAVVGALEGRGIRPQIFFLEARDEILIRRFSETRHRHPLEGARGIGAAIARERRLLDDVRSQADVIIDTSDLSGRQLRERIYTALQPEARDGRLQVQLISFGFKNGVPPEADTVFDVRFMDNPFYHDELRPLSGLTEPVREFVLAQPAARQFLDFAHDYFDFAVPAYVAEGKSRLVVAIGCTGGYHRSITISEELARWFRERGWGPVSVWHRELDKA